MTSLMFSWRRSAFAFAASQSFSGTRRDRMTMTFFGMGGSVSTFVMTSPSRLDRRHRDERNTWPPYARPPPLDRLVPEQRAAEPGSQRLDRARCHGFGGEGQTSS